MYSKNDMIKTREDYINIIREELLGPGSEISIPDKEHELISALPESRYSIGILFPRDIKREIEADDTIFVNDAADSNDNEAIEEYAYDQTETDLSDSESEELAKKKNYVSKPEEENLDEEISLAAQNMPSSMGITFFVDNNPRTLNLRLSFATYRKATRSDCCVVINPRSGEDYSIPGQFQHLIYFDKNDMTLRLREGGLTRKKVRDYLNLINYDGDEERIDNALYRLADQLRLGYVRVPHNIEVSLEFGDDDYIDNNRDIDETKAKITGMKRKVSEGRYAVTLMLVNDEISKQKTEKCIFQPEIKVSTENNDFSLVDYSDGENLDILNEEEQSLALQYRNNKEYATGLGVAVDWDVSKHGKGYIKTDYFPIKEVPPVSFSVSDDSKMPENTLSMKYLSDLNSFEKEEKIHALKIFVAEYEEWIQLQKEKIKSLDNKYHNAANKNIAGCTASMERMRNGISILNENENAWKAFLLANRAMYMQRVHLKLQEKISGSPRYRGDEELEGLLLAIEKDYANADQIIEDYYTWRPFQLAFLLMSISSITNDSSLDRDIVDLIWFPTGGGKTEAYLGLTAFTIFYRRLSHNDKSDGTAVIMRYTLRLLAAQQFTRASTLICACEVIRRDATARKTRYGKYNLGNSEISIGLWIGGEHTPNTIDRAKDCLKELNSATASNLVEQKEKYNKFQVLKCPWCGTKLVRDRAGNRMKGDFGYRIVRNRFQLFCPQEECAFAEKLPIQIIDEELYREPPSLLFGTVDKFAMLPWKKDVGNFFAAFSESRSPELIIQDELHLISGPLGTMVGLYESAIDYICAKKGVKSKIIASTATIRRAAEQCAALYDRSVAQFPHPGLDASDSYFSRESVINHENGIYGRTYVGLMPSGKSKAMMEVRTTAALMQRINMMSLPDEFKDKYWTVTAYFNSLKDLGKMSTLVDDDIKDAIRRTSYRFNRKARPLGQADELTSRVSTTALNETLEKLEKRAYSEENLQNRRWPSNILLATNMISVGIDVARLNVMLLIGQPKLTSEYIQASSRVGRTYPGVVFTLYDGTKSRDRSHYEQFKAYHESFYRHVEPTSATPFSKPARDRALHAILIALIRMTESSLSCEADASKFDVKKYQANISEIEDFILNRCEDVTRRINPRMQSDVSAIEKEIAAVFDRWQVLAERVDEDKFFYGDKYLTKHPADGEGRLLKVFNSSSSDDALDTMTSMRNVDSTISGKVLIWEEDDEIETSR